MLSVTAVLSLSCLQVFIISQIQKPQTNDFWILMWENSTEFLGINWVIPADLLVSFYFSLCLFSLVNFIWAWWLTFVWLLLVLFQAWGCLGNVAVLLIPEGVVFCGSSISGCVSHSVPHHSELIPIVTSSLLRFGKLFFRLFSITR